MVLYQTKNYCTGKRNYQQSEKKTCGMGKKKMQTIYDEKLTSKISYNSVAKKRQMTQFKNWTKDLNRLFSKEDIQKATR